MGFNNAIIAVSGFCPSGERLYTSEYMQMCERKNKVLLLGRKERGCCCLCWNSCENKSN